MDYAERRKRRLHYHDFVVQTKKYVKENLAEGDFEMEIGKSYYGRFIQTVTRIEKDRVYYNMLRFESGIMHKNLHYANRLHRSIVTLHPRVIATRRNIWGKNMDCRLKRLII